MVIEQEIKNFIMQYTQMDIGGIVINCPYWMNKERNGKIVFRGFANGKGGAQEIREELVKRYNQLPPELKFDLNQDNLRKFARRERIGIDCSGFVYRVLEELLRLGYKNTGYENLDKVFSGGINKTDAERLTDRQYCKELKNISAIEIGDVIRLWGGKHAAIIIQNDQKEITYAHSSWLSTKIQGVHTSIIQIIEVQKSLRDQHWMEETRSGENFGKKYFRPEEGDSVFRLKIFS